MAPSATGPDAASGRTDVTAGVATTRCASPEGFRVEHPADWSTNPGAVLPACSWFAADPFSVPEASDERIADVALTVGTGPDRRLAWPEETARTTVEVAGRPALRVEQVAGPGFHPRGDADHDVRRRPGYRPGGRRPARRRHGRAPDYDRNVDVIDALMASLTLDGAGRV